MTVTAKQERATYGICTTTPPYRTINLTINPTINLTINPTTNPTINLTLTTRTTRTFINPTRY